jgi:hypothetical protein
VGSFPNVANSVGRFRPVTNDSTRWLTLLLDDSSKHTGVKSLFRQKPVPESEAEATPASPGGIGGLPTLDSILQDLRYAFRALRRDAGFAAFAILVVGLGVGASSTVFSIVNAVLIRPLPFRDPDRLVWIVNHEENSDLSGQTTQVGHFLDLREQNQSFSDLAAYFAFYGVGDNKLTGQGEPERLSGVPVSANFFQLLGVQPRLGRLFTAEECKWNGPKVVLLGHGL